MNLLQIEKRQSPRARVDADVQCQFSGTAQIKSARLENMSSTGVLIWTDSDVCPTGRMRIWLDAQFGDVPPIEIHAEVVRTQLREGEALPFGYGCRILDN